MKVIIDIDEDVYKLFTGNGQGMKVVRFNLENALKNGTPLPKGHGDLIDRDKLLNTLEKLEWIRTNYSVDEDNTNILEDIIGEVPTIIEEDKGE